MKKILVGSVVRGERSFIQDGALQMGPAVRLSTPYGVFSLRAWVDPAGYEHASLSCAGSGAPLVRVHSECLTGDTFGSDRCDCGQQLRSALQLIACQGGMLVYMRGHEGRGIGLAAKLKAYVLQDCGADTVSANEQLGLPVDARSYGVAAQIIRLSGLRDVHLLSNNPSKAAALQAAGVRVSALAPLWTAVTEGNGRYLQTKRRRLGHRLPAWKPRGQG